jgi:starch synthase
MKVVISTNGKYHAFDLARELYRIGALQAIFTAYPRFKLRNESLPQELIHTFPWVHGLFMYFPLKHCLPKFIIRQWEYLSATTFGAWVTRQMPSCDIYVGLSGSALLAGKWAHQRGIRFVCDRGSAHIRVQDQLLREEHAHWGMPFSGIDPRTIVREEAEYAEADCITIPSSFAMRSFLDQGVPSEKLQLLPYGVNLERFEKVAEPDLNRFDILFVGAMSLQKGVQYLVQAYQKLNHASKSLSFVGAQSPQLIAILKSRGLWSEEIRVLGHIPQQELKELMSRSHVLVLPSIQDGFGMVMAQAMACGCPVIASRNTGAEDLFKDGEEGFIVAIRDVDTLAERLQRLADYPEQRATMGQHALARVQSLGGWQDYGDKAMVIYSEILKK